MASKYVCRSCLQALRTQRTQLLERATIPRSTTSRTFTASTPCFQEPTPAQPNKTQSPLKRHILDQPRAAQTSARHSIAERIRKSAPQTAETYHAYGATEHFINTINDMVGYDIPQLKTKEEVPRLEGGEEIGVATGDGEWYKGAINTAKLLPVLQMLTN
jgi:hypothetical protein